MSEQNCTPMLVCAWRAQASDAIGPGATPGPFGCGPPHPARAQRGCSVLTRLGIGPGAMGCLSRRSGDRCSQCLHPRNVWRLPRRNSPRWPATISTASGLLQPPKVGYCSPISSDYLKSCQQNHASPRCIFLTKSPPRPSALFPSCEPLVIGWPFCRCEKARQ